MRVNLLKLCVGVEDVEHLARLQKARLDAQRAAGEPMQLRHVTRNTPRRAAEVLDGGSLYWVIKRIIRVRQRIVGLENTVNAKGKPACAIVLAPELVRTEPRSFRPFQGWRYLAPADAPRDLMDTAGTDSDMPPGMAEELRHLGLL